MQQHPGFLSQQTGCLIYVEDDCKKLRHGDGVLRSALGREGTGIDTGSVIGGKEDDSHPYAPDGDKDYISMHEGNVEYRTFAALKRFVYKYVRTLSIALALVPRICFVMGRHRSSLRRQIQRSKS